MIAALVQGDLTSDPVQRVASNGKPYWTATIRVATGVEAMFVGVSTFSETAGDRLMKLQKGSTIAAAGTLEATEWTSKDGETRKGWRLTATEVLSVYQARRQREREAEQ